MKTIIAMPVPYGRIHELVELREKFMEAFSDLMDAAFVKVQGDMNYSRRAAMDELKGKPYEKETAARWGALFSDLDRQAGKAGDLASLHGFKDQADALRKRLTGTIPELDRNGKKNMSP